MTNAARAVHPILFSLYIVLALIANNLGEVHFGQALRSLVVLPVATCALALLLRQAVGSAHAAASIASLILLGTWLHGGARTIAQRFLTHRFGGDVFPYLLFVELVVVSTATALILRYGRETPRLTRTLNFMAAGLLVFPLLQITLRVARGDNPIRSSAQGAESLGPAVVLQPRTSAPRDIYYILVDGYAGADVLQTFYGLDNSAFLDKLRSMGFFVAAQSRTNYLSTKLVLPSVLNFEFLDDLVDQVGRQSKDVRPLVASLQRNRVVSALRAAGYRIVDISSGVDYVALADSDESIVRHGSWTRLNEFESVLLEMTPVPELLEHMSTNTSEAAAHRRRVEYAIEALASQGTRPGPKFVFAHIFSPHDPFVFGRQSEERPLRLLLFNDYSTQQYQMLIRAYRDQVVYLNGLLLRALNRVLTESPNAPIVILQGDHGLRLYLKRFVRSTCLVESVSILNAFHLPGERPSAIGDSISPVNTFRVIFDSYFGTDLGLLEDRVYFSHRYGIYDFIDVTKTAGTCHTRSSIPDPPP